MSQLPDALPPDHPAVAATEADVPPPPVPIPAPVPRDPVLPDPLDRIRRLVTRKRPLRRGRVAILRLYGSIGGGARSAEWVETARRLTTSRRVPAVVLDIDSPGGSAAASDYLYITLRRLADAKPVVAHVRGTGASGAYLAAMAARRIVVAPSSIVGSIGVISAGPRVPALLDRLGVQVAERRAGRLKGMGAPWRLDTEEEQAREQELVDAFYEMFVQRVVDGRRLSRERVLELATGEVWLGTMAVDLGLADETGDIDRAIEVAAGLAGVPAHGEPVRLRRPFFARVADRFATRLAAALAAAVADEMVARLERRDPRL